MELEFIGEWIIKWVVKVENNNGSTIIKYNLRRKWEKLKAFCSQHK
jgi:hypothetical protein